MAGKASKKQITLTQALAQFLAKTLLPDLKARAAEPAVNEALQRQWQAEKAANRTADGFPAWQQRTLEQVGAAWVLSCVFVRTLEDRDLLARRRLAGPGALDSEQLFFELAPSLTARDYLLIVFKEVSSLPGAEELLGPRHNPLWRLGPSAEVARALLGFFRQEQEDADGKGTLLWHFDGADTRFLGDLYQDLSEDVRKRFALLQTPDFVERFILEQTLEPAIAEFGLEIVRVIDPTCGSGHFLLGAFDRLLSHRQQSAPAVDVRDHALAALGQVYGVDVNPYAVAIARFRLTLAYLQRTGISKLAHAPKLPLNLVVADSLLHGGGKGAELLLIEQDRPDIDRVAWQESMFALDDEATGRKILRQRYHAVVGNPPYITCKDSVLREVYRERYRSAAGKYALAAPFTERFFELASEGGFVGLINANSFMKREFGKTLIEQVLPQFDLTSVIDTSGAYIPGHGTPTVLLFGRNRKSTAASIPAVLGRRGEPSTPENAEQGLVWRSIVDHRKELGFENDYITVAEVSRATFSKHPWSLGGGGAADLKALLEERAEKILVEAASSIGIASFTLEDDAYLAPRDTYPRVGVPEPSVRPMIIGEAIRDWSIGETPWAFFPYDSDFQPLLPADPCLRYLWPYRTSLANNKLFAGKTKVEGGLRWYEYGRLTSDKLRTPLSITFAEVATHNHFVLGRGGKIYNRTAPIIKLPESATEDDHLALIAYLNSSTACFWMKQVCYPKSTHSEARPEKGIPEDNRFAFSATAIGDLPIPKLSPSLSSLALKMESLVQRRHDCEPPAVLAKAIQNDGSSFAEQVAAAEAQFDAVEAAMVVVQEEIDWTVYRDFQLTQEVTCADWPQDESLAKTDRPFLASAPPPYLHEQSRRCWLARQKAIEETAELRFLETPVFKRRWWGARGVFASKVQTYGERAVDAARDLLAELLEKAISTDSKCRPIRSLTQTAQSQIEQLTTFIGESTNDAFARMIAHEGVPFLKALFLQESGLATHTAWRKTWSLQRREDLGETVGDIDVPRKYDQKDFRDANYWRLRGKLDVPKERFISYPGCEKDGDPSPLIGWAGWNHLQRAQALVALYQERKNDDGWPRERLMPMLVGLHELMFWLEQWHSQPEAGSQNPAREFKQFLDAELNALQLTTDDLEAWRPPTRKAAAKRSRKASAATDTP
jgi:hypothetical protein